MSVESEWDLGNDRWEEIGIETMHLHALADDACHQTSNSTLAIDNTRARVARTPKRSQKQKRDADGCIDLTSTHYYERS